LRSTSIFRWETNEDSIPKERAGLNNGKIQTDPAKDWYTLLRLYSPLEPFFTKLGGQARSSS
jgi:hypothetical protein